MSPSDYKHSHCDHLLSISEVIEGTYFMFQQNNTPIHTTNSMFQWFVSNDVHIIYRSALILD